MGNSSTFARHVTYRKFENGSGFRRKKHDGYCVLVPLGDPEKQLEKDYYYKYMETSTINVVELTGNSEFERAITPDFKK